MVCHQVFLERGSVCVKTREIPGGGDLIFEF